MKGQRVWGACTSPKFPALCQALLLDKLTGSGKMAPCKGEHASLMSYFNRTWVVCLKKASNKLTELQRIT